MRKTIKITTDLPTQVVLPLLKTANAVFNNYIEWCFISNSYSRKKCEQACYDAFRKKYPNLPSGILQSVRDMALESVKAVKFASYPKKKPLSGIRLDKRNCTLRGHQLTISTLDKRIKTILTIPEYFKEIFENWKFSGLQLGYNKKLDKVYVCLNFETDSPKFEDGDVLGIDRGLINVVACSNGLIIPGKKRNRVKRKRNYLRKRLLKKGTRSAIRLKKKNGGREKRFVQNENHIVSKELSELPFQVFVLEKLEKMSKKNKGKSMNRKISNWSYYELEMFLKYKLEAKGKKIEYVDARYTSQRCNKCGEIRKENRKGLVYKCHKCGHEDHADLNAAKNIRDLYYLAIAESIAFPKGQGEVNRPNVLPSYAGDQSRPLAWDGTSLQTRPVDS